MNTPTTTNTTTKEASPQCVLETEQQQQQQQQQHATRLRQVLQYIAWMLHVPHPTVTEDTSSSSSSSCLFVQEMEIPNHQHRLLRHQYKHHTPYFFSETTTAAGTLTTGGPPLPNESSPLENSHSHSHSPSTNHHVIFTTDTFRKSVASSSCTTNPPVPFTFYGSSSTSHATETTHTNGTTNTTTTTSTMLGTKRKVTDHHRRHHRSTSAGNSDSRASTPHHCWWRLVRVASTHHPNRHHNHNHHTTDSHQVWEAIYHRLFDYIQQNENQHLELIWGLGHALYYLPSSSSSSSKVVVVVVNGPLLEVPMEAELGPDGAIYLRPKATTLGSVRIHRNVLTALTMRETNHHNELVQSWYRKVQNDLDAALISPAQPETYRPILQQMAMELLPNGRFVESTTCTTTTASDPWEPWDPFTSCLISDSWCLYTCPKPSSRLSRDALAFVDRMNDSPNTIDQLLSPATWALTLGPGSYERYQTQLLLQESQRKRGNGIVQWIRSTLLFNNNNTLTVTPNRQVSTNLPPKISLPLPSTEAHDRIMDMLLYQNYPCVVVEGPPGTGKSQTIGNMICAYLRVGKRVLVTSKHASSLSVIRQRLPTTIQELCIDVSNSEYNGVRQLQQTVERLSNRLANSTYQQRQHVANSGGVAHVSANTSNGSYVDSERDKLLQIQKRIDQHEQEIKQIDDTITAHYKRLYQLFQSAEGKQYIDISVELLTKMPWLMSTIAAWTPYAVQKLRDQINVFVLSSTNDPVARVCHYPNPPSNALISLAASRAEMKIHVASNATKQAVASIPYLGSWIGMEEHTTTLQNQLSLIRIGDHIPITTDDWSIVVRALRRAQAIHSFGQGAWKTWEHADSWPCASDFLSNPANVRELHVGLCQAVEMKHLAWKLNIDDMITASRHCQAIDANRSVLSKQIHTLSEELVNLTVMTELCQSLSEEALSALIRFSQIAGKAKFHKPNIPVAKMSQRQRRHRDDYLEAFDKCCRYIPCWILTTSQICDFLPPEPLFDLVIIDETSQSDITVLPTMLRGKQWLIVGDGKQVSPTETFISEEQMDRLRASIPECYFESALLPGQSFFDLCAQAFPTSRVVLNEHFRCASEIIAFSNEHFYDGQLIPLRLPTQSERITPSIIDVRIPKGVKVGKINEGEADEIVRRVAKIVKSHAHGSRQNRRTIGIISLMGDEQSRLIRGRLLDTIGPQRMAQHSVLVGDPPSFQGTERDVIFLSMVCSAGRSPSQSQLVHFQRANVAMSRARDQCILIRSLDISDIASADDVKIPIMEFFQKASTSLNIICDENTENPLLNDNNTLRHLLVQRLEERGYKLCCMGVVWNNGICVEHPESDERIALIIDAESETYHDWVRSYRQQQKIEGVGWKCLRIDILSFLSDCNGTMQTIFEYLTKEGIRIHMEEENRTIANDAVHTVIQTMDNNSSNEVVMTENGTSSRSDRTLHGTTGTIKATRSSKRQRTNQHTDTDSKVKQQDVDLIDVASAEVESLFSLDSQSNSNDDNIVVDLSFLRGR